MDDQQSVSRRQFIGSTLAATAAGTLLGALESHAQEKPVTAPASFPITRKIKLGVVGLGTRGNWIAGLFREHGGFELHAVADYFPDVVEKNGEALGVDKARRFAGLSGYRKVIESGIEAIALETPPYFFPAHAQAAVAAGLHVYIAAPVAVDVPGARQIAGTAKTATEKKRAFFVDYQIPTDPVNLEVAERIRAGGLKKIHAVQTVGINHAYPDPAKTETIESRLQHLIWVNDIALGGDYIGNWDVHAIDAALWVLGERPVAAIGMSRVARPDAHGDARGVCSVVYEYASGTVHNHYGLAMPSTTDDTLSATFHGEGAYAVINYWGKSLLRGGPKHFGGGAVQSLYQNGVVRNVTTFYANIIENHFENAVAARAVDGVLTCILGREAAARQAKLTMDELLKENKRLEVDLKGLKA